MHDLMIALEALPGWVITSFVVISMAAIQYVVFRTGISKDVAYNKDNIEEVDEKVALLAHRATQLEQRKVDTVLCDDFRAEIRESVKVNREERRADFQEFKDDVRVSIKEFKDDVRDDINNVLNAIKRNNGIK